MAVPVELTELTAGPLSIGLAPAIGGSLAYFRHGAADLMRPLSLADLEAGNVLGAAMFPMLPYANRIGSNGFDFGGRRWTFSANSPPNPLTLHGSGWQSVWRVEREDGGVTLSLERLAPDEPYSYHAAQRFALSPEGPAIGECDLSEIDRQHGRAELGFLFARAHWGKGYGLEVGQALIALAFGELGLARLWARVHAGNGASQRLLEKLGFTYEGTMKGHVVCDGERRDCLVYGELRG